MFSENDNDDDDDNDDYAVDDDDGGGDDLSPSLSIQCSQAAVSFLQQLGLSHGRVVCGQMHTDFQNAGQMTGHRVLTGSDVCKFVLALD